MKVRTGNNQAPTTLWKHLEDRSPIQSRRKKMELYLMQKRSQSKGQKLMLEQNPEQNWNLKPKQPSRPPDKPGIHQ